MASRKGRPNKTTAVTREWFQAFLDRHATKIDRLFDRVAKEKPDVALRMIVDIAEYCVPKLARSEIVGVPEHPVELNVRIVQPSGANVIAPHGDG